jgi:hypothetical protein
MVMAGPAGGRLRIESFDIEKLGENVFPIGRHTLPPGGGRCFGLPQTRQMGWRGRQDGWIYSNRCSYSTQMTVKAMAWAASRCLASLVIKGIVSPEAV